MENKEDYKIYSTVEKQEVEWLWYPYIPYGKLTLLQGDPGDGKSTFMINIASAREFELIQELVRSRMEKNEELQYESFEGYELPPRTQFSMLKKPAVSIKYGQLTFNMAAIRLFEGVKHVLTVVNWTVIYRI